MSDLKKREELKAKINEELDALSLDELEKIVGGAGENIECPICGKTVSSFGFSSHFFSHNTVTIDDEQGRRL